MKIPTYTKDKCKLYEWIIFSKEQDKELFKIDSVDNFSNRYIVIKEKNHYEFGYLKYTGDFWYYVPLENDTQALIYGGNFKFKKFISGTKIVVRQAQNNEIGRIANLVLEIMKELHSKEELTHQYRYADNLIKWIDKYVILKDKKTNYEFYARIKLIDVYKTKTYNAITSERLESEYDLKEITTHDLFHLWKTIDFNEVSMYLMPIFLEELANKECCSKFKELEPYIIQSGICTICKQEHKTEELLECGFCHNKGCTKSVYGNIYYDMINRKENGKGICIVCLFLQRFENLK
jgi:hypothetical protein